MNYSSLLLNGTWVMSYKEEEYTDKVNPWENESLKLGAEASAVEGAVPGYWEDMTELFQKTGLYEKLKINPRRISGIESFEPIFAIGTRILLSDKNG